MIIQGLLTCFLLVVVVVHSVFEPGLVYSRVQPARCQIVVHCHSSVASQFVQLGSFVVSIVVVWTVFDSI